MPTRLCPYCNSEVRGSEKTCRSCGKQMLFYRLGADGAETRPPPVKSRLVNATAAAKAETAKTSPVRGTTTEPKAKSPSPAGKAAKKLVRLLPILVIAISVAAGVFSSSKHDKVVSERKSSPGYAIVRDLQARGQIESFAAVEPESGWNSEYSLNGGEAHLFFRIGEARFELASSSAPALRDAIRAAFVRAGYKVRQ